MKQAYGRMIPTENETLTHVGPGTPMGELLRRYWQPIATSDELQDLPRRVRILGEDLVAFRDRRGRPGVLDLHCAHRGTSLEWGRVEADGNIERERLQRRDGSVALRDEIESNRRIAHCAAPRSASTGMPGLRMPS